MSRVIIGKMESPKKVVIYGPEGIGKTSLGAAFPGSLLIDIEAGSGDLDCDRIMVKDWPDMMDILDEIYEERDTEYKAVSSIVIDTADWLERLATIAVCKAANVDGIEDLGYGKGYTYVMEDMMLALAKLDMLRNIGMNIILVAHSQIQKQELPGNEGAFDRYELKCGKKVTSLIKEWVDAVLFVNYKITVEKGADGKTRAKGGTTRLLMTEHTAAFDAKNRWGLDAEIEVGPIDNPVPPSILAQMSSRTEKKAVAKAASKKTTTKEPSELRKLMDANEITEDDLKAVMKKQGIKKLTKKIEEKLVAQFDKVAAIAVSLRKDK